MPARADEGGVLKSYEALFGFLQHIGCPVDQRRCYCIINFRNHGSEDTVAGPKVKLSDGIGSPAETKSRTWDSRISIVNKTGNKLGTDWEQNIENTIENHTSAWP